MSDLKVGDRVVAVVDSTKMTGTVRGTVTPKNTSLPGNAVHVTFDQAVGMFITRWVRAEDVAALP